MKKLLLLLLITFSGLLNAQDIFEKQLFSADLILKYKNDIKLNSDHEATVKKIYNEHITLFNTLKWDLDDQLVEMKKLLSKEKIDAQDAEKQMDKILKAEEKLKKMRFEMMVELKNLLNEQQQENLQKLRAKNGEATSSFITTMNENPRVSLKVSGSDSSIQPLWIIKNNKGEIIGGSKENMEDMDPDEIASINVIKGKKAIEDYGEKGENGVIVVILKK